MNKSKLDKILADHLLWLKGDDKGIRADLSNADLSRADLSRANLSNADLFRADLSDANLSNADLSRANLFRADLSNADLSRANLSNADLSNADLSDANLSNADLFRADLSNADLSNADLFRADLSNADLFSIKEKEIITFQFKQHFAYACDKYIKIGCQFHSIEHWIKNYMEIGKTAGYTDREIMLYGQWIELVRSNQRES